MPGGWIGLSVMLALLCGCRGDVVVSPPATARSVYRPQTLGPFLLMNQSNAEKYIVSGVYALENGDWRWASRRAVLRLRLEEVDHLKFVLKFALPPQLISARGPVRLRILLNHQPWQGFVYGKDGAYEIVQPAPVEFLKPEAENFVTIETDKFLPADAWGRELGFILVHAGFQS